MNDLTHFLMNHGGPVLFAIVLVEQAGLPIPAAPWLLAAGALSASGRLDPVLAITLAALACLIADSIWFYVGRRGGQRVLRFFCRMSLSPNYCVRNSKGVFARYGPQGLVAAKFIPVMGTVMPPLAGALGMSTARFLAFDGIGSLLYGGFYIAIGFLFNAQLSAALALLNELGFGALLLAFALGTGFIVYKYLRRHRRPTGGEPRHSGGHRNMVPGITDPSAAPYANAASLAGGVAAAVEVGTGAFALAATLPLRNREQPSSAPGQPTPCPV